MNKQFLILLLLAIASGSKCYGNKPANCDKYGRLYNWQTAKSACPKGWHLPSDDEWNVLMKFVNPSCSDNSKCDGAGTISTMSATTAIGGVPVRTIATSPTAGTCSTSTRAYAGAATIRATCLVFVACRIKKNLHRSGAELSDLFFYSQVVEV